MAGAVATLVQNGVYVGVAIVPHVSEKLWGYANPSLIKAWNALVSTAA